MECDDGLARPAAEDAVLGGSRDAGVIFGDDIQKILQGNDIRTAGTLAEYGAGGDGSYSESRPFAVQLCQPGNGGIESGYFIPGGFAYDAVGCQIEKALEFCDCRFGAVSKAARRIGYGRDGRIIAADPVEPGLDGLHIQTAAPLSERCSGIRRQNVRDDIGLYDFYIVWIIGTQDLQGCVALVSQSDRTPLGHALAGNGGSVAEGSEVGSELPLAAHIFIENIVHDPADRSIYRAAVYKILVIGGAVGNIKNVALVPVRWNHH